MGWGCTARSIFFIVIWKGVSMSSGACVEYASCRSLTSVPSVAAADV